LVGLTKSMLDCWPLGPMWPGELPALWSRGKCATFAHDLCVLKGSLVLCPFLVWSAAAYSRVW
jgi:hypothetical protein